MPARWQTLRRATHLALTLVALLAPSAALAAEGDPTKASERATAARAYDRALAAFDEGRYSEAATNFLEADTHAPSADAVHNALVAARRAGGSALVREAAERAIDRERTDPKLAAEGRAALAELETPSPAHGADSSDAIGVASTKTADPGRAPAETPAAPAAASAAPPAPTPTRPTERKPWVEPVFYAGIVTTAALVGLTIWSGIDTLNAKARLPGTVDETEAVRARAHRTDALLAGSVVVGAVTTYVGLHWFRQLPARPAPAATFDRRGAMLLVDGSF